MAYADTQSPRPTAETDRGERIFADRVEMLFESNRRSIFLSLIMSGTIVVLFLGSVETGALLRWVLLVLALALLRSHVIRQYFEAGEGRHPAVWANLFVAIMAVTGIAWGSLFNLTPPDSGLPHHVTLLYIAAMCAASTVYAAYYWPVTAGFVAGALGPVVGGYFAAGFDGGFLVGGGVAALAIVLLVFARNLHAPFTRLIALRQKNDDLIGSLRAEKDRSGLALEQARMSEEKARVLTDHSPVGIMQAGPRGEILYANPAMLAMMEVDTKQDLALYSIHDFLSASPGDLKDGGAPPEKETGRRQEVELIGRKSGRARHVAVSWSRLPAFEGRTDSIATVIDITERRRAEMTVRHMAHHDALTGLVNRTEFNNRIDDAIAQAGRHERLFALLIIDIRDFAAINETFGHAQADRLLKEMAERLRRTVRRTDTAARVGADQFAVISTYHKHEEGIPVAAAKIVDALARPYKVGDIEVTIQSCIGISVYPTDDVDAGRLIQNAEFALSRAKEDAKGGYRLYDQGLHARLQERARLEQDLQRGLERGEFLLHYQPQIDLRDGRLIGAEALMRWQHPERGLVPPGDFIPLAEATRAIIPMSEWLLYAALAQAKSWQKSGFEPFPVSVNISPLHFETGDLADTVAAALRRTGLDGRWLDLEVTEGVVMTGTPQTIATLTRLDKLGASLSIDDFGTGYSSLAYLKRYPFRRLKIDRTFIAGLCEERSDGAIVEAIVRLAQSLGITVLAEGVETEAQHVQLRALGCDEAQGYLYARPMPADEFRAYLERRAGEDAGKTPAITPK